MPRIPIQDLNGLDAKLLRSPRDVGLTYFGKAVGADLGHSASLSATQRSLGRSVKRTWTESIGHQEFLETSLNILNSPEILRMSLDIFGCIGPILGQMTSCCWLPRRCCNSWSCGAVLPESFTCCTGLAISTCTWHHIDSIQIKEKMLQIAAIFFCIP